MPCKRAGAWWYLSWPTGDRARWSAARPVICRRKLAIWPASVRRKDGTKWRDKRKSEKWLIITSAAGLIFHVMESEMVHNGRYKVGRGLRAWGTVSTEDQYCRTWGTVRTEDQHSRTRVFIRSRVPAPVYFDQSTRLLKVRNEKKENRHEKNYQPHLNINSSL